ncbi:MAG TPA: DGQHR domain-containing protein [Pseudoxanthomonas sp.]
MAVVKKSGKTKKSVKKITRIQKKTTKKSTKKVSKKATKSKKKAIKSPIELAQFKAKRKQKFSVRSLFGRLGFKRIKSDGTEFVFDGRTGEVDDIFLYENIVVLAEYTISNDPGTHVSKKSILYKKIADKSVAWIKFATSTFAGFDEHINSSGYTPAEYKVFICYFSSVGVSSEIESGVPFVKFLDGTKLRYFESLTRAIHQSARHEFFRYLELESNEIGAEVKKTNQHDTKFAGFVLPYSFSSFPEGYQVVSFYADPDTLLRMSYVLRRDSWRDPEGMYQRVLQGGRMNQMRKYLTTEERVFVNNIVVTLPSDTVLNDPSKPGKNLDPASLTKVRNVTVSIPSKSNVIGLVDGQHRVFCYHEGRDKYEAQIMPLRSRQNLLVTGIIYPELMSEVDKRRFEAKLFLEINDKQRRTGSELKQSIELILNPYSTTAISKAVIYRLNTSGPLKGMLQTNYFDARNLIRTTSIVSYGLRPLLKLDGTDSLFTSWTQAGKTRLRDLQRSRGEKLINDPLLEKYILYATRSINDLLIAAKKSDLPDRWKLTEFAKDRHLSPTIINGFIVCLRQLVAAEKLGSIDSYESKFSGLKAFPFSKYKSSNWGSLGKKLYSTFFE